MDNLSEQAMLLRQHINRFVELIDEDWQLLLPHLQEKSFSKGHFFATEGKKAKEIAFVLEGNLRHYYTQDGEEKTTYFYFEHHLVSSYISCITGSHQNLPLKH